MDLYELYRKEHPINPEPSEFKDIIESEVRMALNWIYSTPNLIERIKTEEMLEKARERIAKKKREGDK